MFISVGILDLCVSEYLCEILIYSSLSPQDLEVRISETPPIHATRPCNAEAEFTLVLFSLDG